MPAIKQEVQMSSFGLKILALEVMFLLVLYTVDVNPENRIAVQYLPLDKDQIQRIKDINTD